jgi:hypothetical protein
VRPSKLMSIALRSFVSRAHESPLAAALRVCVFHSALAMMLHLIRGISTARSTDDTKHGTSWADSSFHTSGATRAQSGAESYRCRFRSAIDSTDEEGE